MLSRLHQLSLALGIICISSAFGSAPDIVLQNSVQCMQTGITFQLVSPSSSSLIWTENTGGVNITSTSNSSCVITQSATTRPANTVSSPVTIPSSCITWAYVMGPDGTEAYATTSQNLLLTELAGKKNQFSFNVNCLVAKNVIINGGLNNTGGGGGNGGNGHTNTSQDVGMFLTKSSDGTNLTATGVSENTPLTLNIRLAPTQTEYLSMMPYYCYFTNGFTSSELYFIQNDCPVDGLLSSFQYLKSLQKVDKTNYLVNFTAFHYSQTNQASDISIECELLLCTNDTRCTQTCWNTIHKSSFLVENEEEEEDQGSLPEFGRVLLTKKSVKITVLAGAEPTVKPVPVEEKICLNKNTVYAMYAGLGVLGLLLIGLIPACCCVICGAGLGFGMAKRRREERHRHHHRHSNDYESSRGASSYSSRDSLARRDVNQWVASSSSAKSLPRSNHY